MTHSNHPPHNKPLALVTAEPVFESLREIEDRTANEIGCQRLFEAIESYRDKYERRAG